MSHKPNQQDLERLGKAIFNTRSSSTINQNLVSMLQQSTELRRSLISARTCPNTARSLKILLNLLDGTSKGIESNQLTLKQVRELYTSKIKPSFIQFEQTLSQETANNQSEPVVALSNADIENKLRIALSEPREIDVSEALRQIHRNVVENTNIESKQALLKYINDLKRDSMAIRNTVGKHGYSMLRQAIIPIFSSTTRSFGKIDVLGKSQSRFEGQPSIEALLKGAGIKSISLGEYGIIEGQLLLLVSKAHSPSVKVGKKTVQKPELYAQQVIDVVNSVGESINMVTDIPAVNPRNSDILMFWVMESGKLSYLTRNKFPKIQNWGLPV